MPEGIVVDWFLRFPRSATTTGTPKSHFQCGRYCHALPYVGGYVCFGVHMLYNIQVIRGRPSLLYDHTNVILRVVVKEVFYCMANVLAIINRPPLCHI